MKTFLLYCDLSTMNCTVDKINATLNSFTSSFIQVNDSLWFFKYDVESDFDPLPKEEHLFYDYFRQFTSENSTIFIDILHDKYYYQFPDAVCDFLELD